MKKTYSPLFPLFFCFLSLLINTAKCDEDVNLTDIPANLATHLGISTFEAGILASLIFAFIVLFPIAILRRKTTWLEFILGIGIMSLCVAISWMPSYTLILIVLLIAGLWGGKFKGLF